MSENFREAAQLVISTDSCSTADMAGMTKVAAFVVQALKELLQEIEGGRLPRSKGVCQEIDGRVKELVCNVTDAVHHSFDLHSLMYEAVCLFPEFSGNPSYPVRCPGDERVQDSDADDWNDEDWAYAAFWRFTTTGTTEQWEGGYGKARIRYAEWLLGVWKEVEAIINTKEV